MDSVMDEFKYPNFSDSQNQPWGRNFSNNVVNLDDLKMDSNFAMLLCSLIFAIGWVIYITYYNSRLAGYIITKIVNRLFISKDGYFKIGSFTLNALSGKIMFRDVIYITLDYSVRIQDGYLIFRWWRSYVPKDVSEDLSHSDTRLSVVLNGLEVHVYNRTHMYSNLAKMFNIDPSVLPENFNVENQQSNEAESNERADNKPRPEAAMARTWRDLIPVIKADISSLRLVFGNRLVPTTLSITVEESHFVYSTKPAVCQLDRFMHFTKWKAENARVMLVSSPKYTGMLDDPPRYMGEGFVLMSTNDLELYFYMDEPGLVPEEPVTINLPNGDIVEPSPPQWGIDIKCGKGTDFSYGPWADRQREHLFKFFYPQDYLPMEVTKMAVAGEKRQMHSFDIRLSMQSKATVDILFSKNKETNAVHVNLGPGSYLEISIPWVTTEKGYTSKITGQLFHTEATTSLQFRDLLMSETLEFSVLCHYPLMWNDHQLWEFNLTGGKATVNVLFCHKWFFTDLMNDWSTKQRPDLLHFVPYTWRFGITFKHCELITPSNEYNWVDCTSAGKNHENGQIAFCAHFLHLSFDLPFDEFLPDTLPLNFSIQGESIDFVVFIPEYHTSRITVMALEKYAKIRSKDGKGKKKTEAIPKWRNVCTSTNGWVDFWWIPIGAINIGYVYHPCPPLGPTPQADISTPVKEEILLSPMRFPRQRKPHRSPQDGVHNKFDPTTLKPDIVTVEIEVGPSVLLLYGTALRNFVNCKENLFGDDQMFFDMQSSSSPENELKSEHSSVDIPIELQDDFDMRDYRPIQVDLSIIIHDVQAHILKNCMEKDPSCPVILIERFGFEMKKRYDQTELQLLLSPTILLVSDPVIRPNKEKHLNEGRLTLSSLQVRGHAMFSDVGRSLDEDTIEYAWLVDVQLGRLSGKISTPQLHAILTGLETLLLLLKDNENEVNSPTDDVLLQEPQITQKTASTHQNFFPLQLLQTRSNTTTKNLSQNSSNTTVKGDGKTKKQPEAKRSNQNTTSDDLNINNIDCHKLKYKVTRLAVDVLDLWLVESGVSLQIFISPVRLAMCNLHGKQVGTGLSCVIYSVGLRQCIYQPHKYSKSDNSDIWLEVGSIDLGPLVIESATSSEVKDFDMYTTQQKFLKIHDDRHKKLWFLWPELNKAMGRCGCVGGCLFFGSNKNGTRFFKPSPKDLEEGMNVAAFRVNEPGRDPGYGQSVLHESQLIFRTPPYTINEISLQDSLRKTKKVTKNNLESPKTSSIGETKIIEQSSSVHNSLEKKGNRRYSSTSIRSKDIPYARLVDNVTVLANKLDSDSKLHTEKTKLAVVNPDVEPLPKNSVSDSKLAVDYFNQNEKIPEKSDQNEIETKPAVVNVSESHHSLGGTSEERLRELQVQRTISMSSENQSEAFYSADEDINLNSRCSSLRNSMLSSNGTLTRQDSGSAPPTRKKYSSELSIVANDKANNYKVGVTSSSVPENSKLRLSSHRSDHEIHTPEHRSFDPQKMSQVQGLVTPQRHPSTRSKVLPKSEVKNVGSMMDSSDSYSSNSYVSAIGSQDDFTLVDLHMQINRQIIDSPLLMSSYVGHLKQIKWTNWNNANLMQGDHFSVPLFQKNDDDKLVYIGGRFVPIVEVVNEGVTSMKMVSRSEVSSSKTPTKNFIYNFEDNNDNDLIYNEEELLGTSSFNGTRTSVIIKLKGDLDVMITPLLLESFQRFIDALIPTVANLHPMTVINHLHTSCVEQVVSTNLLKTTKNISNLTENEDGYYEETLKSQFQASIIIPKVNITMLQVSIVEEIISFSALDNMRDLTCASLFSVCFDNITTKFHSDNQTKEVIQKFYRPVVQSSSKKGKKHFLSLHSYTNPDIIRGEPVFIESCEQQQKQLVISLSVGKVHAQLRRLKNECSVLDDAVITAIPNYSSKVLFTAIKLKNENKFLDYYLRSEESQENVFIPNLDDLNEEKLGFIMFECGLEGVNLKVVKKFQQEQLENDENKIPEIDPVELKNDNKSSNKSTKSVPTQTDNNNILGKETPKFDENNTKEPKKDCGNVISCVIELKTVWFNFAAPPRTPITRKIDYTRLDWNLLSTASPAINAWMNPSNRLAIRVVHMVRSMYRRSTAIVACLMTEALDAYGGHLPVKTRYGKLTPLSKTLQDDPSCQLCTILQKYYLEGDVQTIEANLRESDLPQLFVLRQGVIVLSRQWKPNLYTPLLPQQNVKTRLKPLNVTIAIPEIQQEDVCLTDGEQSANEDADITDEHAQLLHTGIILKPHKNIGKDSSTLPLNTTRIPNYMENTMLSPQVAVVSGGVESLLTSPSPPVSQKRRKMSAQPPTGASSGRASVVLPLLNGSNPFLQKKINDANICYGALREDHTAVNLGSDPSVCTNSSPEAPLSPLHRIPTRNQSSEDLYSWMAKQDVENFESGVESKIDTLQTQSSGEETTLAKENQAFLVPLHQLHDSWKLLDANLIFQPLLSSLGVMPQQLKVTNMSENPTGNDVTSLDALGSNLSLVGNMETMRIDIVVSEHGKMEKKRKGGKTKQGRTFLEINTDECPAFVCEKVSIELELDRMTDMAVSEMIKTKNVLYISRGQLKNHTSTVLHFNVGVRYISQRVNMPLLRLLHQISNMYQNVKDTQNELREQQPTVVDIRRPKTSASDHVDVKHNSTSTSDLINEGRSSDDDRKLRSILSDKSSIISQKPVISPSPSIRSRPQSLAQKLISTGKSVKGYVNLNEGGTPVTVSSPSISGFERVVINEKNVGRCWRTINHLLDLYANMPDTKTIKHRFSVSGTTNINSDVSEHYKGNRKYDVLTEVKSNENVDKESVEKENDIIGNPPGNGPTGNVGSGHNLTSTPIRTPKIDKNQKNLVHQPTSSKEHTKLIVFGVARIHKTRLLATLSGLKLEAEITSLHSSLTCRKKSTPSSLECSLTGQIGRTMIVLLEGVAPNLQTVVKVTVGKSQALYSSVSKRSKDKNSGLLTVGAVNIDIPQHPVALHGMVTRGSKQLSSTLQELRVTRTSSRLSRLQTEEEVGGGGGGVNYSPNYVDKKNIASKVQESLGREELEKGLLQPLVMQFSVILQSLSITAALLPSLQAQYKMDQVNSTGTTGSKAKFTIDLPHHSLSFTTKLQVSEANLPSEASIALPAVHVSAEYIPESATATLRDVHRGPEGVVFMQGGYLSANAEIGVFEHSLTTDLLNHLVFVQKVFMKEVNEVVQKVYGGERPVPIWLEDSEEPSTLNRILFSLIIKIQRIQLTATTAGSSAVRLETGAVVLELSNRVQNVSGSSNKNASSSRLFGRAQVDFNLSLGQLIRNVLFEEADTEFQQFAYFKTRVGLRNMFQDEITEGEEKEVVLITLKRPLIYIQPVAVDKAILVWLNYKNAYDYWNEKRANLNKEVLTATQQVYEKFQLGQITSQLGAPHVGMLFLQLTVEDMGICLPLNPLPLKTWGRNTYEETRGAVVITLDTSISACNSGSLVSKGKFSSLCLRFEDDFETSLDDWKPDMNNSSNLCVVSDGTYEVCSRTIAGKQNENAKWFLNVQWQMEGVDIHLDTNIGKQLSALGHTLTQLTGAEDSPVNVDYDSDENDQTDTKASQESILPAFVFDPNLDYRKRSKLIEREMNEQAKIINDLRSLGASHGTIELELKKLHELEAMVFKDFRRDMIQKLRRQSMRGGSSSIKGKILGSKPSTYRSRSFIVPSPMLENQGSPEDNHAGTGSGNSASYESSPRSGPSRSASLRVRSADGPRVTFGETHQIDRQSSLPSASSDLSLPEANFEWAEHLNIDGQNVDLRKKLPYEFGGDSYEETPPKEQVIGNTTFSSQAGTGPNLFQKPQEPNIDLELDVKVFINSGKCVLHTKDKEKDDEMKLRMRKDRSCSAGLLEFPTTSGSPDTSRKNKEKLSGQTSSARLRNVPHTTTLVDLTIFHIPGMDVKLYYQSKVVNEENLLGDSTLPENIHGFPDFYTNKFSNDSNLTFEKSEEIRIEKAFKRQDSFLIEEGEMKSSTSLHGISNPNYGSSPSSSKTSLDNFPFQMSVTPPHDGAQKKHRGIKKASLFAWMTLQSVPEETIISPHILEFLEQSLDPIPPKTNFNTTSAAVQEQDGTNYGNYVYASFPVDVIVYFHMQPSTFRFSCLPVSRVECMLQLPSLDIVFSSKRAEHELLQSEFGDGAPNTAATAIGGLSVTGCLSDFSVYIFHPYGGKKTALKEAQWSPLSDSERKDSLSINVEFVKFHLTRSRMLNFQQEAPIRGKAVSDQSRNVIRFSTITDIGSASFKYDMRRLTEILAFPKAWYRRSIVRRMFLGDLSMSAPANDEDDTLNASLNSSKNDSKKSHSDRSPLLNNKEKLKLALDDSNLWQQKPKELGRTVSTESANTNSTPSEQNQNLTAWETLVLFAVNFKKLNVHMNMGNVMGNVSWLTKDFRSEGRLSIGSTGHKNLYIAVGLGGSGLDAKGGIVGGNIEIANIDTFIHIREEPDLEPDHIVGLRLAALELRLDYMATSVLMCRVSDLIVNLRDDWSLNRTVTSASVTRRPASIFIHGDLSWNQLQIMMSKSSTADLLKMYNKLEEFFSQQFNSSKRVFSGFSQSHHHRPSRVTPQKSRESTKSEIGVIQDARHHRHWQKVLADVAGLQLSTMHSPLPKTGTVLGGNMELHGKNISLACFHGINFKSRSWALFSLKEPCITFNTESQEIPSTTDSNLHDVHVVQTLQCSLGVSTYKTHQSMAMVCKVSRSVIFPPQFKTLQEWFHYAFANSQIDEVDKFPSLERERDNSIERSRGSNAQKLTDPNHNREVIFALPSLQLHLKTEHLQTATTPDLTDEKPVVECSFITEFEDHIFVTVDAEAFFFLHDLISSYLKEKEKVLGGVTTKPSTSSTSGGDSASKSKPPNLEGDIFAKDWRNYNCKTWHLEPTVRLLSVAGKYLEPYGIDYILQKLGFAHARTTIPKWMQRGFMDPLDAILAVLTLKMVRIIKGDKDGKDKDKIEES
nr:uncharacterized protein KIAA1109 isoform X2 [Onthophagus taurus]